LKSEDTFSPHLPISPSPRPLVTFSAERAADGCDDFLFCRESEPAFFDDHPIINPDGEFACIAFDQLGFNAERLSEGRCRTGSARLIASPRSMPDDDSFHRTAFLLEIISSRPPGL